MTRLWIKTILIMLAVLSLDGCNQKGIYTKGYYRSPQHRPTRPAEKPNLSGYHVVAKGETLYSIAWEQGYDYRQLAYWNGIRAPYTIFPQQKLRITPPPVTPRPPVSAAQHPGQRKPTVKSPAAAADTPSLPTSKQKLSWRWPAKGQLITTFSSRDPGRKGVDIAGRLGQPVYAAAAGKVVYSGSGLRGYGDLIIIKHNDTYFSAYAHNKKNLVKEDQYVKVGQHIADMGNSGTDRVMLHFEVRRNGKPVNPLHYLPRHRT